MDRILTLRYDDSIVRAGLRGYVSRYLGWKFGILVGAIAAGLAVLLYQGVWRWYTVFLIGALTVCVLAVLLIHAVMVPLLARRFRQLYGDASEFHFTEAGLGVSTHSHKGHTPWSRLRRLWREDRVWLLFTGSDSFTILPAEGLPEDVRAFIIARVEANGGEVA